MNFDDAGAVPRFIILGAMKCGTTTLHDWLAAHADVEVPETKELDHLCDAGLVANGRQRYLDHFPSDAVSGEASPRYLFPPNAPLVARTVRQWLPETTLIVVLRDPVDRLLSHYQHEVLRGREKRPLQEALRDPDSLFIAASMYDRCLAPFFDEGLEPQLHIVVMETLVGDDGSAWTGVLQRLGLSPTPRPGHQRNASSEKQKYRGVMRRAFDLGLHRYADRLPASTRRVAKRVLLTTAPSPPEAREVPSAIVDLLHEDRLRVETRLGVPFPWAQPPTDG